MDLFTLALMSLILPVIVTYSLLIIFWHTPSLRMVLMHYKLMTKYRCSLQVLLFGPVHLLPFVKYRETLDWLKKLFVDGFDRIAASWLVGLPLVFVNDPDDIEILLSSTKHIDKGAEYDLLKAWLQDGLLLSTGGKWHTRRKLLTPTFHFKILEDKSQTMYANARKFVQKMLEENGQPFAPYQMISSCTLDVIGEAAMGVTLNSLDGENLAYRDAIARTAKAIIFRILFVITRDCIFNITPTGRQDIKDVKFLHGFTNKIIADRRAAYSKIREGENHESAFGEKKRQTFLDTILELDMQNQGRWTDSDIREEVDTFLFEGHDTTAALLQFAIFELGQNPDVQECAYQEQYEIFGDESRETTLSDIQNMNYLERFIKECLRLYPSVPYLARRLTEDLHLKDLPPIVAGTNVTVMPYFVHRNPKWFPDPETFDPNRFLPEECAKRHPFAYIPFSAGPRNCIGQRFAMMELKVLLSTLIRFAKVEPVTMKGEFKLVPFVILRSLDPIYVKIIARR
uniref:Cytochrome P450 monooxygenase CYP4FC1 n=1 Tax=Apolygus lucorum TaxID=248454 RepID=A0A2U7QQF5_APOLU|nr:cytochrome P450 monooxygenase CYP4FC1 [Apolygus lucorum]